MSDLPPAACRILAHGAEKDPVQRFHTAAELIAAFDELLVMKVEELEYEELLDPEEMEEIFDATGDATAAEKLLAGAVPLEPHVASLPRGSGTAPAYAWSNDVPVGSRVAAAMLGIDRLLRRLVGEENDILRYFLWAVLPLLLLGAVWAGVLAITPSPVSHNAGSAKGTAAAVRSALLQPSTEKENEPENWTTVQVAVVVGNVEVMVLRPTRGAAERSTDHGNRRAHRASAVEPQGGRNEASRT